MTPTPTQTAEWRDEFEREFPSFAIKRSRCGLYEDHTMHEQWQGYLRACTKQATEKLKVLDDRRIAETIHNLTAIAKEFGTHQSIRQRLSGVVVDLAHGLRKENDELKAKLAEVMPLAKYAAWNLTLTVIAPDDINQLDQDTYNKVIDAVLFEQDKELTYRPNIEATIEKLLKD